MNKYQTWSETILEKVRLKIDWVSDKNKERIPYTTGPDGSYDDRADETKTWETHNGLCWWTNGFWGGLMWLMYADTRNEKYADYARANEYKLKRTLESFYGLHHDIGFMFQTTAVANYRMTGSPEALLTALRAVNLLAGRYNPAGNFIRAWNDAPERDNRGWVIVDSMFNISLLFWASRQTRDPRFRNMAERHADTVMHNFIRNDGSAKHIVAFSPETGEFEKELGGQGYAEGSAWARGQGWALYGFINAFKNSGRKDYFDTARRVADYCLKNLPESGIVPIDFLQPPEPALEDSCAAVVIATGLIELYNFMSDGDGLQYLDTAAKILKVIDEKRADWSKSCDAIVQNCSERYHDSRHHITMVYADYFFVEALYLLKANTIENMW